MPDGRSVLIVPLDASAVTDRERGEKLKVAVMDGKGDVMSQVVELNADGAGVAKFALKGMTGSLQVAVGPEAAGDEELFAIQTLRVTVPGRLIVVTPEIKLPPIKVPPFYWIWWRRWCVRFEIRGRVVCPDGKPVPGARVCAYDVDWWWWWTGRQLLGCDTTDAAGTFSIPVRWCCGWLPWWWWRLREWALEPVLTDKIIHLLKLSQIAERIPIPEPRPGLRVFEKLAGPQPGLPMPGGLPAVPPALRAKLPQLQPALPEDGDEPIDAAAFLSLRERLMRVLPQSPEMERLKVWPWVPWNPWWDCRPDIIFRATQNCDGKERVIVNEGFSDARWDVGQNISVTLVAREACCIDNPPDPAGDCIAIGSACNTLFANIGGNAGAPVAPVGYANPGLASSASDIPFSGDVVLAAQFGTMSDVDYYELEWDAHGGPPAFAAMPAAAAQGFTRVYFGPGLGGAPGLWHSVPFNFTTISGRNVIESRERFEQTNDPGSWGVTRFWVSNRDVLMVWRTADVFADGVWDLRVETWKEAGGALQNPRILPLCNTQQDNAMVLRVDNRVVLAGSPPTSPSQPCGSGTVHVCTTEPDTDLLEIRVDGRVVGPCGTEKITDASVVEVDFLAYDPDGHLYSYELTSHFGDNQVRNMLNPAAGSLAAGPATLTVPSAAQVGPNYLAAVGQGAVRPAWRCGVIRLTNTKPKLVFPESCAYMIKLRAYKRNIVNCDYGLAYRNESTLTFTVLV
jgi:hypothetical protein